MRNTGIGDITVSKSELLDILIANRAKHREVFEKAVVAWKTRALQEIEDMAARLRNGQVFRIWSQIPLPEEHTDDYTRAIDMLNMHQGAVVALSEEAYEQLVNDEWGWRAAFLANTASYVGNN